MFDYSYSLKEIPQALTTISLWRQNDLAYAKVNMINDIGKIFKFFTRNRTFIDDISKDKR